MPITEKSSNRLVLKSGSTTLELDKDHGRAVLQRKIIIWRPKPTEGWLNEISNVNAEMAVDRASGVEIWHTMLVFRSEEGWALPAANKQEAYYNATVIREFLTLD